MLRRFLEKLHNFRLLPVFVIVSTLSQVASNKGIMNLL